uniref:Phosphate transport system permease protein n=1 Tax=candidate division WOR-3 bacterium TaxID=2052148 RepID=A0A7C4Y721_UNCW3
MKDTFFKRITLFSSYLTIGFLILIVFSIFKEGIPGILKIGIKEFIFGRYWAPYLDTPQFGIYPLIVGSIFATLGALIVSIPLGVGTAIYVAEIANPKLKEIIKPFIEILAGIPSVIFGLFGMAFLGPLFVRLFNISTGLNLFTASIILGIMVLPIISSISEDAISSVPKDLREASYALGANRWETIIFVVLPKARVGIISAIVLGFGRAIGETMVVLMVAGGASRIPKSIFCPVRTMTATIAAEMGETMVGSLHFKALFGIGVVLFIITLISIMLSEFMRLKKV